MSAGRGKAALVTGASRGVGRAIAVARGLEVRVDNAAPSLGIICHIGRRRAAC